MGICQASSYGATQKSNKKPVSYVPKLYMCSKSEMSNEYILVPCWLFFSTIEAISITRQQKAILPKLENMSVLDRHQIYELWVLTTHYKYSPLTYLL